MPYYYFRVYSSLLLTIYILMQMVIHSFIHSFTRLSSLFTILSIIIHIIIIINIILILLSCTLLQLYTRNTLSLLLFFVREVAGESPWLVYNLFPVVNLMCLDIIIMYDCSFYWLLVLLFY